MGKIKKRTILIVILIISLGIKYYMKQKKLEEFNEPAERIKYIYDGNGKIVHEFKYEENGQLIREWV